MLGRSMNHGLQPSILSRSALENRYKTVEELHILITSMFFTMLIAILSFTDSLFTDGAQNFAIQYCQVFETRQVHDP